MLLWWYKFSKVYQGKGTVYKFIEKMVEETKYCKYIKRKNFKKELVMTKGNNKKLK